MVWFMDIPCECGDPDDPERIEDDITDEELMEMTEQPPAEYPPPEEDE